MMELYLKPWNDAHVHLREPSHQWGIEGFGQIIKSIAIQCRTGVVMPNTAVPVQNFTEAAYYRALIKETIDNVTPGSNFEPLMALYLTERTSLFDVQSIAMVPWFAGWKLYPQGVTTGSQAGVSDIRRLEKVLRAIEEAGSRLLIHGETTRSGVDILNTEEVFVNEDLPVIREMFKGKICLEHCSTRAAVDAVVKDDKMWGSVTPHHLTGVIGETDNPHNRCKPTWQTEENRQYLLSHVLLSSNFFAGSDSAPHPASLKAGVDPLCGCFNAPTALALYFQAFLELNPIPFQEKVEDGVFLRNLNGFLYGNMAKFYGLTVEKNNIFTQPTEGATIKVVKNQVFAPTGENWQFENESGEIDQIVPLRAGEKLQFDVQY